MRLISWLLSLLGLGKRDQDQSTTPKTATATAVAIAPGAAARAREAASAAGLPNIKRAPVPPVGTDEFRLARRRVIAYVARARTPIRQAAAVRQLWLADLGKVYAEIASSPTGMVLDKAGTVGAAHEPAFREALGLAQSIEPPPEAEMAHAALVGWLTCLDAACLALMDARKLRDRSILGAFREQLGRARRLAVVLVQERNLLFSTYRLLVRASIKARRTEASSDEAPADGADAAEKTVAAAARPARRADSTARAGGRPRQGARRPKPPSARTAGARQN